MSAAPDGFWKKAARHPQQLFLRRAFFQVHLWAGVLFAIYIAAISVSGSILVFKDELMPRPHTASIPFDARSCTPQHLIQSMNAAAQAHPDLTPSLASCPTEADPLYAVVLHPRDAGDVSPRSLTFYVHPRTGEVVGQIEQAKTWVDIVDRFHIELLLKNNGRQWNGVGGAVMLVLAITGLPLWWPGVRNWRRALQVDLRRTWKRMNWDLHSAVGIWTVFFTLTWAVTGVYFAWPQPFERAVHAVSNVTTAVYPAAQLEKIASRSAVATSKPLDLQRVLEDAETRSPGGSLEGLFFGTGTNPVFTVYVARGHLGDYTKTDFVYFDQATGSHLYTWHRGVNHTLGDWMLWLLVPLHFGTSWGLPGKIIWCALGLALPTLVCTGLLMYWNRWLRKQFARPGISRRVS